MILRLAAITTLGHLVLGLSASLAQTTAAVEGRVLDPQSAPVAGAEIRILEKATNRVRTIQTDSAGWYRTGALAAGLYDVEAERAGFRIEVRRSVALDAGRTVRLDFTLQLGEQREAIEVTAAPQPLSLSPSDWGASAGERTIRSLPLNGRDLFDIAAQLPGAQLSTTTSKTIITGRGARFSVNGSRPNQNSFRLDGVLINDATGASPTSATGALLGLETIREVRVSSSAFDAEYGRTAGAVLTAVSKSGSNEWHGSAFEYLRNSSLDARNFFDVPGEPAPPLKKHQFGGLFSGPALRDRLFFLASYEGLWRKESQTKRSVAPTVKARSGELPGQRVQVSPLIEPYLALYPLPNGKDYGDGTGEFISVVTTSGREDLATAKADWAGSRPLRLSSRYTFDRGAVEWPEPLLIFRFQDTSRYHFFHNQADFFPSPTVIHSFRAAFSRVWNYQTSGQPESVPLSLSFLPGRPFGTINFSAGMTNLGGDRLTGRSLLPRRYVLNDFQFSYALAHMSGRRSVRTGLSFDRVHFNQLADLYANGFYTFSSLFDFLQASPASAMVMSPGTDTARGWRQNIFAAFLQIERKLTNRAGLSLGVRYETYSTPSEVNGKVSAFPGDFFSAQAPDIHSPLFANPSRWNFAPRAGLSYALSRSQRTALRAGAGLFYDVLGSREIVTAGVRLPPYFQRITITRPAFPDIRKAVEGRPPESALDLIDYHLQQPYVLQFQFQLQHQLPAALSAQVGYAGARGVHLMGFIPEYNPNRPETLQGGKLFFPATLVRMNPALGSVVMRRSQFDSAYHAFQASLTSAAQKAFRFQLKYAWSKSIDNNSNAIYSDFINLSNLPTVFDYRANRGPSDFDLRHAFSGNVSWILPGSRGSRFRLLEGWELHALFLIQSGAPFNPTVGFDRARISGARTNDFGQRPNLTWLPGSNILKGTPEQWFDPRAFDLPPAGMLGNLGRNTLRGPHLANLDAAVHKQLWATERHSVRLRAEFFNLTNHPNFQVPSNRALFDSNLNRIGAAGQITSTTTPARQIQLALRYEF